MAIKGSDLTAFLTASASFGNATLQWIATGNSDAAAKANLVAAAQNLIAATTVLIDGSPIISGAAGLIGVAASLRGIQDDLNSRQAAIDALSTQGEVSAEEIGSELISLPLAHSVAAARSWSIVLCGMAAISCPTSRCT
jgi:hypothetical protein